MIVKMAFRVKRTPTVAVGVVRVMKQTANLASATARTLAVDTRKTIALPRNLHTRRITKTAFQVRRSLIVATDVVEMMEATANPLPITARTLAADTRKTMASSRNSHARTIRKVQTVSATVFKGVL